MVYQGVLQTYRSNRCNHIVVTEQRSPWPANEQSCRIEDQTKCHRKRRCNRDQSTAVSRVDHSARPHVLGAEYHGSHGCNENGVDRRNQDLSQGDASLVKIYISAHGHSGASDLRLV